ncbi:MAG: Ig-like domain-containing protein [Jatrophihabitans sp.]
MQGGRKGRLTRWSVLALTVLVLGLGALQDVANAEPWGTTGASYSGILCQFGASTVPLGAWTVNGIETAFSTQDIVQADGQYPPAPLDGNPSAMTPGQAGFTPEDIAAVAYLIQSTSAGSPAVLAEVSADIASVAGDGSRQQKCLGQGGTSAARAAARLADARKFAGPYTISVDVPANKIPGTTATVTARVVAASGTATPGLSVDFQVDGQTSTAVTDRTGVAGATINVPAAAASTVTAEVQAPTALIIYATDPSSVGLGPTTTSSGSAVLRPALHPKPVVSVSSDELVLDGGSLTPTATVTGTFGYSGNGTLALTGPVAPGAGKTCAALTAAQVTTGNPAWDSTFSFSGDGPHQAGDTPTLTPGCYVLQASVATSNSEPRETAASGARVITVSTLTLTEKVGDEIAPPGSISATMIGTKPGRTQVSTTINARGPVPPQGDGCAGVDWTSARAAGQSEAVSLARAGSTLAGKITVPKVSKLGCYTLAARSVVSLDGLSAVVQTPLGQTGTTTIIAQPALTITALDTAGEIGKSMTGTVTVLGSFQFPGIISVGLRQSTSTPITGCRDATFPAAAQDIATAEAQRTTLTTRGDGNYTFRTPVASRNTCYAVTATVFLTDNKQVRGTAPDTSSSGIFLAAVVPQQAVATTLDQARPGSMTRAAITFLISGLLILTSCVVVFVRAFRAGGRWDGLVDNWVWRATAEDRPSPASASGRSRPSPRPRAGPDFG